MVRNGQLAAAAAAAAAVLCTARLSVSAADGSFDYDYSFGQSTPVPPRFLSVSGAHVVRDGNTTVLPCVVHDRGNLTVMWERPSVTRPGDKILLTAGNRVLRDQARLRLVDGYNLQISRTRSTDAGVYTCSVALADRDLEQTQTLDVQYGPTLRTVPETGLVIAEQRQNVTIECHATGNPAPRVRWRKKVRAGGTMVDLQEGGILLLDGVTRSDSGVFECVADNWAGDVQTASVTLQVLYKPKTEVERSTVYTGEGFKAQLVCFVHADPIAEVQWSRRSSPLTGRHITVTNDAVMTSRHVLTIARVGLNDFDTYTCNATNQLGTSHGVIAVLGVADKVQVLSTPMGGDSESYDLSWTVVSHSPVIEYKIAYRKTKVNATSQRAGRWKEVLVPTTGREPENDINFHQQVTLRGLTPATAYDLHVRSKNKHGWSRVSDTFHFSTIGRALESRSLPSSVGSQTLPLTKLSTCVFSVSMVVIITSTGA